MRLGEAVVEAPRGQELEEGKGRICVCNTKNTLGALRQAPLQRRQPLRAKVRLVIGFHPIDPLPVRRKVDSKEVS